MADWNGFLQESDKLLKGYSDQAVKRCLVFLDVTILNHLSPRDRTLMQLGLSRFSWAKEAIYTKLLRQILQDHPDLFKTAPPKAIENYNKMVGLLFIPEHAKKFLVPGVEVAERAPVEAKVETLQVREQVAEPQYVPKNENRENLQLFLKQQSDRLKRESIRLLEALFRPEYLAYPDFTQKANKIVAKEFSPPQVIGEFSDEEFSRIKEEALTFCDGQLVELAQLVEAAKLRIERLGEMAQYAKLFFLFTAPAKEFKDLVADYHHLEEDVRSFQVSPKQLQKGSFEENEALVKSSYEKYLELKKKMPNALNQLIREAAISEVRTIDNKAAVKRRLFEIFWNISPYQDLSESFHDMKKLLTDELREAMHNFYTGKITSSELLEICQEMPYEHDVVKLRNEISHRSARLKDLRDELLRLYREVSEKRRFLEIASLEHQKVYQDIVECQATVKNILSDVENPFKAFLKAETKDDINYVFRAFWIRVEEVQPALEAAVNETVLLLEKSAESLKAALLRALDTLEEALSKKEGTRPQLVLRAERECAQAVPNLLYRTVISLLHVTERSYSISQPFSFFMLVPTHELRLSMLEDAISLDSHIQGMIDFAKAMQYVKTFEEERVDSILEAFERQHVVEELSKMPLDLKDAWDGYVERMQIAARLVEDEIFLDVGLLDRRALMDVDQKALKKTLLLAIERAKMHTYEPRFGLLANLQFAETSPLCKKTLDAIRKRLEEWTAVAVDETKSIDELLEHLRSYCHNLFDAKVIIAAHANMLLPKCLEFINEVRSLERYVEESLLQKRTKYLKELGISWIPECRHMRAEIETFEPEEEAASSLEPLVKKVFGQINELPEYAQFHLEAFQKELEAHLREIEEISKNPKKEHPFIYIPGYLAFFEVGARV